MVKRLSILILLLFFVGEAHALGSVVKNDFVELEEDESARFTILFWSDDDQYVELWIKNAPDNWIVIIDPDNFKINRSIGNEYIALPNSDTKKALPVVVFVKPTSMLGRQHIIIGARAAGQDHGIVFKQERLFNLTVETKASDRDDYKEVGAVSNDVENLTSTEEYETNTESSEQDNYLVYLLLLLIPLISILIYKYA